MMLRRVGRNRIIVGFGYAFVLTTFVALCTPALWGAPEHLAVSVPQPDALGSAVVSVPLQEEQYPSVTVASTIDWDHLVEGDPVPLWAFPAPLVEAKAAHARQVAKAAKSGGDYVSIPSMNVVVPIETSAVRGGQAVVPSGRKVGWVNVSKKPGSKSGVTVLAGHLTNGPRGADAGPLFGAEHLRKGAIIKVAWHGATTIYRVTGVTKHPRNSLPPTLLDPNGASRVALTTCTGPYVLGKGGQFWLSRNAIVWAERV